MNIILMCRYGFTSKVAIYGSFEKVYVAYQSSAPVASSFSEPLDLTGVTIKRGVFEHDGSYLKGLPIFKEVVYE